MPDLGYHTCSFMPQYLLMAVCNYFPGFIENG